MTNAPLMTSWERWDISHFIHRFYRQIYKSFTQSQVTRFCCMLQVLIDLSNTAQLDNMPRWLPLKEQCEGEHHRRSHSGQGRQHSAKVASGHSSKTSGHSSQDSPKSSVIKSRSHGIFPDPAKGKFCSVFNYNAGFPLFPGCHFAFLFILNAV